MPLSNSGKNKGFASVEAVLTLIPMSLFCCLVLEMARRPWFEVAAHWTSFVLAREALVLGPFRAQSKAKQTLNKLLKPIKTDGMTADAELFADHWRSRVWIRYPAFARFPWKNKSKHHFEVTKRCTFSFRSY